MTDRPGLTDEAISAMLVARADRLVAHLEPGPLAREVVAGPRAVRRGRVASGLSWLGLAAAGVVIVVCAGGIAIGPRPAPAASAMPSGPGSAVGSPSASARGAAVEPLTAEAFGELARRRSAELAGRFAVVRGTIELHPALRCGIPGCSLADLTDAGGGFSLSVDEVLLAKVDPHESITRVGGAFLVRFTARRDARDQPSVDVISPLVGGAADGWTSTVRDLLATTRGEVGEVAAIDGWLVRNPLMSCPSVVQASHPNAPSDAPQYGCSESDVLTDEPYDPVAGGTMDLSADGIIVPNGSYDQFAPSPAAQGIGVAPRRAIYLVKKLPSACPDANGSCANPASRWGMIEGVLEPIPAPTIAQVALADVIGWHPSAGTEVVTSGWLVATPALRCPAPGVDEDPSFGCSEYDILTTEPVQIWQADGIDGSLTLPTSFLRVQNGAYDAFAPDPQIGAFGVHQPRFGTFRIRLHVGSTCDAASLDPGAACAGGPTFAWEILARADGTERTVPIGPGGRVPGGGSSPPGSDEATDPPSSRLGVAAR